MVRPAELLRSSRPPSRPEANLPIRPRWSDQHRVLPIRSPAGAEQRLDITSYADDLSSASRQRSGCVGPMSGSMTQMRSKAISGFRVMGAQPDVAHQVPGLSKGEHRFRG